MAINFFAQFRICQRVSPMILKAGGGRIVNMSGETGIMVTNPPFLSSCTAGRPSRPRSACRAFSRTNSRCKNIRVNCVVFVNTPERFAKWERELARR